MLSFKALFTLAHRWLELGLPLIILDHVESIVLVTITVYFAIVLVYDLTQERIRAVINFIVHLFSRQTVFA
jgi:hypothetical protein